MRKVAMLFLVGIVFVGGCQSAFKENRIAANLRLATEVRLCATEARAPTAEVVALADTVTLQESIAAKQDALLEDALVKANAPIADILADAQAEMEKNQTFNDIVAKLPPGIIPMAFDVLKVVIGIALMGL